MGISYPDRALDLGGEGGDIGQGGGVEHLVDAPLFIRGAIMLELWSN